MQKGLKAFLGIIGRWIPQSILTSLSGQPFLFPFYHTVSNAPLPHVNQVYRVRSFAQFYQGSGFSDEAFSASGAG